MVLSRSRPLARRVASLWLDGQAAFRFLARGLTLLMSRSISQWTGNLPRSFTAVYGPTNDQLKVPFLDELRHVRAASPGLWTVAGDFNLIVEASEKSNDLLNRRMMGRFRCLLNDLG
jgi:hypothetical protein